MPDYSKPWESPSYPNFLTSRRVAILPCGNFSVMENSYAHRDTPAAIVAPEDLADYLRTRCETEYRERCERLAEQEARLEDLRAKGRWPPNTPASASLGKLDPFEILNL